MNQITEEVLSTLREIYNNNPDFRQIKSDINGIAKNLGLPTPQKMAEGNTAIQSSLEFDTSRLVATSALQLKDFEEGKNPNEEKINYNGIDNTAESLTWLKHNSSGGTQWVDFYYSVQEELSKRWNAAHPQKPSNTTVTTTITGHNDKPSVELG